MKNSTMNYSTMNLREWLLLFFLSVIWGGSFFFNEVILRELRPFTLIFMRTSFAAAVLFLVVYATGRKMPTSLKDWASFAVMGLLNNMIPFSLIVWGQQYIGGGLAAIINATTPLFAVVLAHYLTSYEKLSLNRVVGVILGVVGVTVLFGVDVLSGIGTQGVAQIFVLAASCSYAFAGIYGRRFRGKQPIIPATGMLMCTAVVMFPLAWLVDGPIHLQYEITTWYALLGLAVLSTSLAYSIYFRLLRSAGATNALLVTFLVPVSAILLGVVVLGESLQGTMIAGLVLIFAGLISVDGRFFKRLRSNLVARS